MIVYFAPGGRLGNQVFQLAFILSIARPGETCVLSKMKGAFELFPHVLPVVSVPDGPWYRLCAKLLFPFVVYPLCGLRVLGSISEDNGRIVTHAGLCRRVRVLRGYFQSESFFAPQVVEKLRIRSDVAGKARVFLESAGAFAEGRTPVFVHVRRTDYLTYHIFDTVDPSLPCAYYEKTIRWFIDNVPRPFFVFVGDDPGFVEEHFGWVGEKVVSRNDAYTDLAAMSLCRGAILSNSTLAWWGARFMEDPVKVFAPRFWLGWKSRRWYPEGIEPSFAELVEVE
jgi:hypothetical protein